MAKNWAMCVGINQYDNLSPLNYAVRDAEAMRDYFTEVGFDQVYLFTDNSPAITDAGKPFNSQPSFGSLRRFLRVRFEKAFLSSGDNFWFFFSGHGMRHGEKDYLLPCDGDPHPEGIEETAIPLSYVSERLRRCGADNVVLLLDACRNEGGSKGIGLGEEEQQGVITLASCSPSERSYEIEALQQGSFTYALLEALRIQGVGNCATVERLEQRLRYRIPEINQSHRKPKQNPYAVVEPAFKYHLILLPNRATLQDVATLKLAAFEAQTEGNFVLAEQLWTRILAVSPADAQALKALRQIWTRSPDTQSFKPVSNLTEDTSSKSSPSLLVTPSRSPQILTKTLPGDIKLEMVKIPAGSFTMGSDEYDGEKPKHQVKLQEFYLGKYPVTQEQYQAVMGKNPSNFKDNPKNPVEQVSWNDAQEFCKKLNQLIAGKDFRLPTEAEWEYACRAGTQTRYYFGDDAAKLGDYGWYDENSGSKTHPVGQKKPNDWGLYDMSGNVWEWCEDPYHDSYANKPENIKNNGNTIWSSSDASLRVLRGGSWFFDSRLCRSADRYWFDADFRFDLIGFRLVLSSF
ncbi:MAG: SUMF1/EgtB/PvdO family nonheme iron enzyme [Woronichinia naegeliana WA131]|uniref:SUMF1/EgtB/PvdO family nonheme iron enzyme n=1 Tax=Woronichinia naegeliana WA131 TaxID=2824559 RepID=A0A977L1D6_9CYAN|nr:MAG: SUMF1/EgtB/PvdO family nonheme iron enzyme [Woronichinia naegeliana WA131]